MQKILTPAERLIVAADFNPRLGGIHCSKRRDVELQVIGLAHKLKGTGVTIKVNAALAAGYDLIDRIHDESLPVFADLKLNDIPETLKRYAELLQESKPDLLTVMCTAGSEGLSVLVKELPETEVLGVTILTSLKEDEVRHMFGVTSIMDAVTLLAQKADAAGLGGIVCSSKEAEHLRDFHQIKEAMAINTPAIRPKWSVVKGDDQNLDRVMTPEKAIKAHATRLVVGRPITQAEDPYASVMRTIEEIALAIP